MKLIDYSHFEEKGNWLLRVGPLQIYGLGQSSPCWRRPRLLAGGLFWLRLCFDWRDKA